MILTWGLEQVLFSPLNDQLGWIFTKGAMKAKEWSSYYHSYPTQKGRREKWLLKISVIWSTNLRRWSKKNKPMVSALIYEVNIFMGTFYLNLNAHWFHCPVELHLGFRKCFTVFPIDNEKTPLMCAQVWLWNLASFHSLASANVLTSSVIYPLCAQVSSPVKWRQS